VKAWREGRSRWALAALLGCFVLCADAPSADAAGTGTITGIAKHASTPVEKVEVEVFDATTEKFVSSATTSATGEYMVTVAPGSYKVGFFPASGSKLVSQYYDKQFSLPTADVVPVVEGKATENIGAELGEGGKISGTVTDIHGNPLPGIEVTASSEASGVVSATTEAAGKYTLAGLAQGSYTVSFYPAVELNFVPQYYNGASSFLDATPVLIKEEKTAEVNTELQVGGEISGRVTDAVLKTRRPGRHGRRRTVTRRVTEVLATGSFSLAPGRGRSS